MCCCVRAERAVPAPGDAQCAPRSLAHRLRRIGDELEKRWATGGDNPDPNAIINNNNNNNTTDKHDEDACRVSVKGMHLLCTALQVSVIVLFVGWRHL